MQNPRKLLLEIFEALMQEYDTYNAIERLITATEWLSRVDDNVNRRIQPNYATSEPKCGVSVAAWVAY